MAASPPVALPTTPPENRVLARPKLNYPALDGVRAIACLMVFWTHLFPHLTAASMINSFKHVFVSLPMDAAAHLADLWNMIGFAVGSYGVTLFFALSAFLITSLLIEEKNQFGTVHVREFYLRRVLRIWPLYFLILFLGIVLSHVRGGAFVIDGPKVFPFLTFTGNFAMSKHDFQPYPYIALLWSVCVEEQFYLVWPHVVKYLNRALLTLFAALIIAGGITFRVLVMTGASRDTAWFHTLSQIDCFGYGCLAAVWLRGVKIESRFIKAVGFAGALLGIIVVEQNFPFLNLQTSVGSDGMIGYTFTAALCALAVWFASQMNAGLLTTYFFRRTGQISYGLYCFQGVLLPMFITPDWVGRCLAMGMGTYLCARTSYDRYESYFLRLKEKLQFIRSGSTVVTDSREGTGDSLKSSTDANHVQSDSDVALSAPAAR